MEETFEYKEYRERPKGKIILLVVILLAAVGLAYAYFSGLLFPPPPKPYIPTYLFSLKTEVKSSPSGLQGSAIGNGKIMSLKKDSNFVEVTVTNVSSCSSLANMPPSCSNETAYQIFFFSNNTYCLSTSITSPFYNIGTKNNMTKVIPYMTSFGLNDYFQYLDQTGKIKHSKEEGRKNIVGKECEAATYEVEIPLDIVYPARMGNITQKYATFYICKNKELDLPLEINLSFSFLVTDKSLGITLTTEVTNSFYAKAIEDGIKMPRGLEEKFNEIKDNLPGAAVSTGCYNNPYKIL